MKTLYVPWLGVQICFREITNKQRVCINYAFLCLYVCAFVCLCVCVCVCVCERWFRSKGGLAVHRCGMNEQSTQAVPGQPISCSVFDRTFSRSGDLKRHKCLDERAKPICEQRGAFHCQHCKRWLRSAGGLAIHQWTCNPP